MYMSQYEENINKVTLLLNKEQFLRYIKGLQDTKNDKGFYWFRYVLKQHFLLYNNVLKFHQEIPKSLERAAA